MKIMIKLFVLFVIFISFNTVAFSSSGFFQQNSKYTGYLEGAYDKNAIQPVNNNWSRISRYKGVDNPAALWSKKERFSGLVIGKDNIIYATKDKYVSQNRTYSFGLYAFDKNGMKLWDFTITRKIQANASEPVIGTDGTIYFSVEYNGGPDTPTDVYAIRSNGKLQWNYSTTLFSSLTKPVLGKNGFLYFGADYRADRDPNAQVYGCVLKISSTGKAERIGKFDRTSVGNITLGTDNLIYLSGSMSVGPYKTVAYVMAVGQTGIKKWQYKVEGKITFSSSILVGSDKVIYIGTTNGYLHAINQNNGKKKWIFNGGDIIYSTPVINNEGLIIFGCGDDREGKYYGPEETMRGKKLGKIYALNKNGVKVWEKELDHGISVSPIIDSDGKIYIISYDGTFMAFNSKGKTLWTLNTDQIVYFASIYLNSEGNLLVDSAECLIAVGSSDSSYSEDF